MNRVLKLVLAAIFVTINTFGSDFLDNQHDYNLTIEWSEVVRYDKQYVKHLSITPKKYNRSTYVINWLWEFNIDLGYDLELAVQAYKFLSNEYRIIPGVRLQINFCEAIEKNVAGLKGILKYGNFTGCPLKRDRRDYICTFTPDPTQLPPLLPVGKYMVEYHATYKSKELYVTRDYATITHSL